MGYAALVAAGLTLTWGMSVFEIVSYASRAFAFYYALQSSIAAKAAVKHGQTARAGLFAGLGVLGLAILIFGAPVE